MVFNPTSPIRAFGRKPVIVARTATPSSAIVAAEKDTTMSPAEIPRSSSPLTGWRGGVSRLMRQSQERHAPPPEISRWSKTTTESEASEAIQAPAAKKSNVLKKKNGKQARLSKDTTNSSPVDPSYDPTTKTLHPIGDIEMPPGAVTGPDEPRSFYDSGSDESSDNEHIIHRASSVRVARPHIIQHSNASGGSVPKLCPPQASTSNEEPSTTEASSAHITGLKKLQNMAAAAEQRQKNNISGTPADALKALEGQGLSHESTTASTETESQAATATSSSPANPIKETILEFPDTPSKLEALDTLPTPFGGFGSVRIPSSTNTNTDTTYSSSTYSSPESIDGLRANPVTETDKKLSRAISAPVRNPVRRVMIRPADLVINRTNNDPKLFRESIVSTPYPARHSSIGEIDEVQAPTQEGRTPRSLRRAKPLSHRKENESAADEKEKCSPNTQQPPEVPLSTKPLPSAPVTSRSDRFPSPVAPEILFLDLRLARHPSARVTVEIEVSDKTTFDDEALFTTIGEAYNDRLLGFIRRFLSARTLSYASVARSNKDNGTSTPTSSNSISGTPGLRGFGLGYWHGQTSIVENVTGTAVPEIDGLDFIKHLLRPRLGRRRKMWLLWLRNSQYTLESFARRSRPLMTMIPPSSSSMYSPHAADDNGHSPVYSFMHSRQGSSGQGENPTDANDIATTLNTNTNAGTRAPSDSGGLGRTPTVTIPRMPFQPSTTTAAAAPYRSKSTATTTGRRYGPHGHHTAGAGPPTLYLHYTFSIRKILAMLCIVFFMAVFTATMWVLLGVPGRGADQGNGLTEVEGKEYTLSWRRDAQSRVGVGLVLGIVVLGLGLVTELVWVWASWILV
ncbi:hypothetical protein HRR83_003966 [Exophiala dermatitidis]|uniref:Uncharacterized protein n=1 Tax=Exophiala dermatitidis TaxID=5970 RepID=A0AAN6F026_EXODE|nr:hypothetical protein HRR74_002648 [Exophiala dermatitidis]KAJ4529395.1 hypothetical protein HRR73_000418 [Exophiala dermatitidis]KAJ4543949.1 hypothetical protein HRR76_002009 [Exophiala dermatitidis]KAJ4549124.1 hypothetical protein HRR77_004002 [Exophiala dermatitidis]KAJ4575416.1 hypothetical protein HRR79_002337 [Exophiala dermatitidis]